MNIYINASLIEECRKGNNKAQYSLYNQYSKAMFNLAYRILNNREATPLLTKNPEIKKELNIDLSQLDSICSDLKKDLKDNVSNQEVVEALIQNYRIKIRLLEDMLTILKENENNPEKKKSHEL